jgi:type 1 fimbria pilin
LNTSYFVYLVLTGTPPAGVIELPQQNLGRVCLSSSATANTQDVCVPIGLYSLTLTVTYPTCSIYASDQNQSVALPSVWRGQFGGPGTVLASSIGFSMRLTCPPSIKLMATLTDASSPANTGNTLSLTAGSSAAGVGVQVYYNGASAPLLLGPDSAVAGNTHQFLINAKTSATTYTLPFAARYVQTGAVVTPGAVKAIATITFSYQ